MGDVVIFRQDRGLERAWVPRAEEAYWIRFWGRGGVPAARWTDYLAWGRRFYPPASDDRIRRNVMLRPKRRRTNYRRWHAGY